MKLILSVCVNSVIVLHAFVLKKGQNLVEWSNLLGSGLGDCYELKEICCEDPSQLGIDRNLNCAFV